MKAFITKPPTLIQGSAEDKRQEIRSYFHQTFSLYEKLYDQLVSDEAFYRRANPLRHPLVFYLGHTAVFLINKLVLAKEINERVNPRFESLFAIGVDEMSWDDLNEAKYDWPTIAEVKEYRNEVRDLVDNLMQTKSLQMPISWNDSFWWTIMMGIEHERIHLETSSVLIRELPIEYVQKDDFWPVCPTDSVPPENQLLTVPKQAIQIGRERSEASLYGWDNEFGKLTEHVDEFAASKYLVSNKEYLDFVEAEGYFDEKWWTEEGWKWVQFKKATHPQFWLKTENGYQLRLMNQVMGMPWSWPVEVNYLEAKAFTNWKSVQIGKKLRLPTEAEYYSLHQHTQVPDLLDLQQAQANINLEQYASSVPVNMFAFGDFYDIVGNVWQWTETPIAGFPGFEVHPLYDDFSTPTFDTKHNLFKGGSWISTGNEATKGARYAFRRHFYQHAGFRYIESETEVHIQSDVYENDLSVSQYCEFHYGDEYFGVTNFPKSCIQASMEWMAGRPTKRALDLGCAVGRSSFELAQHFDEVTAIDFSARFIRIAYDMQEKGYIQYILPEEGDLISYKTRYLKDMSLSNSKSNIEFVQGDGTNLKSHFTNYDLVFCGNLIDRMYDPLKFLKEIHSRINVGGLLVLTSPYTWLEEFTKKENWVGGYKKDGENYTTLDGLDELLGTHFTRLDAPREIEFVIRETKRKHQHTVSEFTVWERK